MLDAGERVGDPWRARWDSLTLFSPARYSALPGMAFPGDPERFPSKDEMAEYLERYAARFAVPLRHRHRVTRLWRRGRGFVLETSSGTYEAEQVIVATGAFQRPVVPRIASQLADDVFQVHSAGYRNPAQLPDGPVLVVGAANSGIQIAEELAATREVTIAVGTKLPALPRRILGKDLFWWLDQLGLVRIPVRSRAGRLLIRSPDFLPGLSLRQLAREHAVHLGGRAVRAHGSTVALADGAEVPVAGVVWATGYRNDFGWIDVPVLDADGEPIQRRGTTPGRGLYFVGLRRMHTPGSTLIGWVGRDAEFVAGRASP